MNKQLTASEIHNVAGLTQTLVSELGCAEINAASIVQLSLSATSCDLSVTVGDGATATVRVGSP